ncbi:hypothetical protein ACF0H5_010646 [Mactra antiquata]
MAVIYNILFVCLSFCVGVTEGGECCKAYSVLGFRQQGEKWCADYCCGSSRLGLLECCSEPLLVAPASDRKVVCLDFFFKNVWVAVLIGLAGLGIFICIVVICVQGCGGSKNRGQVNAQPATNVIMMTPGGANNQQQQQQQQGLYPPPIAPQGYGPNTSAAFPPQYQAFPGQSQNPADTETKHPFGANA